MIKEPTHCPAVFWSPDDKVGFIISKIGRKTYFPQFYYAIREQFGTGKKQFDDLADCVVILLQAQADHERNQATTDKEPAKPARGQQPTSDNELRITNYNILRNRER